jgi:hypothetical protein
MIGLFALRCIAPLAFTLVIGHLMNKLVRRWQTEDVALAEKYPFEVEPAIEKGPRVKLPSVIVPCWILRNCDPAAQAECAARQQPGLPCWMVRLRVEGLLPLTCPDCPIYLQALEAIPA